MDEHSNKKLITNSFKMPIIRKDCPRQSIHTPLHINSLYPLGNSMSQVLVLFPNYKIKTENKTFE